MLSHSAIARGAENQSISLSESGQLAASVLLSSEEKEWLEQNKVIRIGIDHAWYPYEFIDNTHQYSGISADYLSFASQVLDVRFDIVPTENWNQAFSLFKEGEIDLLPAIIPTEKRQQNILFTKPYFVTPTVIVSRKNAFYATSIESLEGKKLALVKGFAIVEYVKKNNPEVDLLLVNSIKDGLYSVESGAADAYIGAISGINSELMSDEFPGLIISAFTPFDLKVAMAVSDNHQPLVNILDKVFASMSNRQKASIANTWLSVHVAQGVRIEKIFLWGAPPFVILLVVVLVIIRLNRGLKREVARRREAEKSLLKLAQHDPLTDLPNRRLFSELAQYSLAKAKRDTEKHAVMFIDIDGFKMVNDDCGHQTGDYLLQGIAERLKRCVRDSDIVARHGGDEFLVLLNNDALPDYVSTVASKIIEDLSQPFLITNHKVMIGASIGIAIYPDTSEQLEELIIQADKAMYIAKNSGKNQFHFHVNNR